MISKLDQSLPSIGMLADAARGRCLFCAASASTWTLSRTKDDPVVGPRLSLALAISQIVSALLKVVRAAFRTLYREVADLFLLPGTILGFRLQALNPALSCTATLFATASHLPGCADHANKSGNVIQLVKPDDSLHRMAERQNSQQSASVHSPS